MSTPTMCTGHAAFGERLADLVALAQRGEWDGLAGAWADFAAEVADHLDYEEREIFEDYAHESVAHAEIAAALRADHAELRGVLGRIAAEIEARHVREQTIETFVARLHVHAEREGATVYTWLEQRRGTQHRRDRAAV